MPDDEGKMNLNEGWAGAIAPKPGADMEKGWQPTEEYGYQPTASSQPTAPPQGGSGMPEPNSNSGQDR
jgi:hypothetical protein